MIDQEDNEFLRRQVTELTNLLHNYRAKYPALADTKQSKKELLVIPPWNVDSKLISPLLLEYQSVVNSLTADLEEYDSNYKVLQKHVDQLISENSRLLDELQDTVEEKLSPLQDLTLGDEDLRAVDNLQMQMRLLTQEKNACSDLYKASRMEVTRLEKELNELRTTNITNTHWVHLQNQCEQMKVKYVQTINELNHELKVAQDEARKKKNETDQMDRKLQEFKKSMRNTQESDRLQGNSEIIKATAKAQQLEIELEARTVENANLHSDLDNLHVLVDEQLEQIRHLAKVCGQKEADKQESAEKLREAIDTAEDAVLEKTEMSLSLKNYQTECDRLREELTILCDKAGKKVKDEVDKVQSYNDVKINKLNDTIHSLEMENGALKAEIERSGREKRCVESELEKVYREGVQQAYEDGGRYDKLSKRACDAERERDEIKIKLQTTEAELKQVEMRLTNEKLRLSRQVDQLNERFIALQKDFNQANIDRLKHLEDAQAAEELANTVKREAESANRKHLKEMMCIEQCTSLKQTEYETKLQTLEETHRRALNKLRDDVNSQQQSASQWRDEYNILSDKWEKTVQALRTECSDKESRINELTQLLKEARDKTVSTESMIKDYTNQMRRIELRTKDAERRTAEAIAQNAMKDKKIKQLLLQRQELTTSQRLKDSPLVEDTFRMSEIHEAGDMSNIMLQRPPSVLSELSLNRNDRRYESAADFDLGL